MLEQCLGEQQETQDLLVLTSEPVDSVREVFHQAYPSYSGLLEVHSLAALVDFTLPEPRRWPLVCVLRPGLAADLDKSALNRLLALLRDLHADRVIHVENDANGWSLADSLALGFSQRTALEDGGSRLLIFEFELRTYKMPPDWLNAKHWANPDLWGKHRW